MQFYQRPAPSGAQDIGTWMSIFQFLSVSAVITNAALVCFTMNVLWDRFDLSGRLWYVLYCVLLSSMLNLSLYSVCDFTLFSVFFFYRFALYFEF